MTAARTGRVREIPCGTAEAEWLAVWYRVVCGLPAARGCDARLEVVEAIERDGFMWYGEYDDVGNVIRCAESGNGIDALATLLHEVAHFAQNPRHRRDHGYSWRRAFVALCAELTGVDPTPIADRVQRDLRRGDMPRREALDFAATHMLWAAGPTVYDHDGDLHAWCGTRSFVLPRGSVRSFRRARQHETALTIKCPTKGKRRRVRRDDGPVYR